MTEPLFSARDAAALAGVSYRQLDYWCRTGRFTPTVEADGCGSRRGFSGRAVQHLEFLARLSRLVDGLGIVGRVAEQVKTAPASIERPLVFVDVHGQLHDEPVEGWCIAGATTIPVPA